MSSRRHNSWGHAEVCPHCGSEWFYERRFDDLEGIPDWVFVKYGFEDLGIPNWLLLCLCGTPLKPSVGGMRGGRTPNRAIANFYKDYARAQPIALATEGKLKRTDFLPLREALAEVAGKIEDLVRKRRLRRQAARISPVSKRSPAGSGRDLLVVALQRDGWSFQKSRQAISAILQIWEHQLIERRPVVTPFGRIEIPGAPHTRQSIRFGRMCVLFLNNRRIRLKKKNKILFSTPPSPPDHNASGSDKGRSPKTADIICPECGGSYFDEVQCGRFQVGAYSSSVGGGLLPLPGDDTIRTFVCMCGCPLMEDSRAIKKPLLASFRKSLEKAHAFRQPESFEQRLQTAEAELVSDAALEEYRREVSRLQALAELLASKPAKSNATPQKPAAPCCGKQPTLKFGPFTTYDLVLELSSSLSITSAEAEQIVKITFEAILGAAEAGKRLDLRGFGSFSARARRAWKGRNPTNTKVFETAAKRVEHFKPSKRLTALVNAAVGEGTSCKP